jgi:uncharacterized protein (DUF697 family)
MTTSDNNNSQPDAFEQATAEANNVSQAFGSKFKELGEAIGPQLYQLVERSTVTIGKVVTPIANNPLVRFATKVPVISWLFAALGQVNVTSVQNDVEKLRQRYPLDSTDQLAHRIMAETAWKAAGVGLLTNALPPMALMLFAVDIGAIAALQAKMIYRIATLYGFSPTDPTRQGEVLTLWGLSTGSSSFVKSGLSIVEIIPGLGALVGVTSDAALLYTMGYFACRFYEEKRRVEGTSDN